MDIQLKGQAAGEPEWIVAKAVCDECDEPIDKWMTELDDGYPPVYTWKHQDGLVLCESPRIAVPRPGTEEKVVL